MRKPKISLWEKFKARCLKNNLNPHEVLNSVEIDEMLLISQIKPKLLER